MTKWGKIVLIFQAIVTLILGIIFLAEVISLSFSGISKLQTEMVTHVGPGEPEPQIIDLKQRYSAAAYILLFISSTELVIIGKLLI